MCNDSAICRRRTANRYVHRASFRHWCADMCINLKMFPTLSCTASTVQRCQANYRQNTDQEHQIRWQTDRERLLCDLHRTVQGHRSHPDAALPVSHKKTARVWLQSYSKNTPLGYDFRHDFHKSCIDPWLLEHRTCPMCKMDILKYYGFVVGSSSSSSTTSSSASPSTPSVQSTLHTNHPNHTTTTTPSANNTDTNTTNSSAYLNTAMTVVSPNPPTTFVGIVAIVEVAASATATVLGPLVSHDAASSTTTARSAGSSGCSDCVGECSTCGSSRHQTSRSEESGGGAATTIVQIATESRQVTDVWNNRVISSAQCTHLPTRK